MYCAAFVLAFGPTSAAFAQTPAATPGTGATPATTTTQPVQVDQRSNDFPWGLLGLLGLAGLAGARRREAPARPLERTTETRRVA